MPPLKNIRHELFVLALLKGMSQQDAAIEAGYKPSRARFTGADLVTNRNIIDRIVELHRQIESDAIMPVKERKEILSEIGRGQLTDFIDKDGHPTLTEDTPHGRAAAEFYIRESYNKQGDPVVTKGIKLHNPMTAIGEINKMEHIYESGASVVIDNRILTINVKSEKAKITTQRLIDGERTGGNNDH